MLVRVWSKAKHEGDYVHLSYAYIAWADLCMRLQAQVAQ